jgi:23S rRNA A2030 N6-methylase RlmJ
VCSSDLVEVIGLSGRAKVVVFGCCYGIAIGYVAVDSIGRDNFYFDLRKAGVERLLRLELTIAAPTPDGRLVGTGLCVINPPHVLAEEARILLPWLANRMALEPDGRDARFMVKG